MKRKLCLALVAGIALGTPRFEVASVKPVEVVNPRLVQAMDMGRGMMPQMGLPIRGKRVEMRGYTLSQLIAAAYRIPARQIVGPDWLSDKRFDIDAIIGADASPNQAPEMLQTLLQERFGLRASPRIGEQAGFAMVVRKGGPTLTISSSSPSEPSSPEDLTQRPRRAGPPGSGRYEYKRLTMSRFREALEGLLQAPVEDRTELKDKYDFVLEVQPPLDAQDRDPQPRILEAVRKLGLELKGTKVAVQTLMVESVQKVPTPN